MQLNESQRQLQPNQYLADVSEKINEVHKHIPFFRGYWQQFCRMVEKYATHIIVCKTDPQLMIEPDDVQKQNEQLEAYGIELQKLKELCNKYNDKLKCVYEDDWSHMIMTPKEAEDYEKNEQYRKIISEKEAKDREMVEQYRKIISEKEAEIKELESQFPRYKPPEPGCLGSWEVNIDYLNVGRYSWEHSFWVKPGPVNPVLWFDLIVDMFTVREIQRNLINDERLICDAVMLSVTHDKNSGLNSVEETVYSYEEYEGKYFARDNFCRDLGKQLKHNQARIQRAFDYMEPHLVKWREADESQTDSGGGARTNEKEKLAKIPPIKVKGLWNVKRGSLEKLRQIDSNPNRSGIPGTKKEKSRLKQYLSKHRKRPDVADTLYWDEGRIKTKMAPGRMFSQE